MSIKDDKRFDSLASPALPENTSGLQKYLDCAIEYHKAGQLNEAQAGYRKVLLIKPDHADALHMMGVLAYQAGRYDEAVSLINRAKNKMLPNAGIYTNFGNVLQAMGRLDEAIAAFQNAIGLAPDNAVAYNNLGNALQKKGELDAAVTAYNNALKIDSSYAEACVNLAMTYQAQGDDVSAARSYERAVALDPGQKSAAHMLAALRGEVTEGAPPEHIEHLFDDYAQRFESHLVDTLGYTMPGMLRAEIDKLLGPSAHFHNAIDIGCGTGLAGIEFRSACDRLNGVDLSSRMIGQAKARNVYDDLHAGDVIMLLESDHNQYDLFICADVFPYIGNIKRIFSAVSRCAKRGALFAFSTEHYQGEGFILQPSGRYAHSQEYLRETAAGNNLSVMTMRTEKLRKQRGRWIPGDLVVLKFKE